MCSSRAGNTTVLTVLWVGTQGRGGHRAGQAALEGLLQLEGLEEE